VTEHSSENLNRDQLKLVSIILAAGKGTRMRSNVPKVLHPLLGAPLLEHVLRASSGLASDAGADSSQRVVVVGYGREEIRSAFASYEKHEPLTWAVQDEQRGTGHAAAVGVVEVSRQLDASPDAALLVLNGDLPLLRPDTLRALWSKFKTENADVALLTCTASNPHGYGRIVRREGLFCSIIEERDADETARRSNEINVGTYLFRARDFRHYIDKITPSNAQGELYLTDVVTKASEDGKKIVTHTVDDEREIAQVNDRRDLANAQQILRSRLLDEYMTAGVTIVDPVTTYIELDVAIGKDTIIHPFTHIERGIRIGEGCQIGPFCHLRPGTMLHDRVKAGNFVEIKNSSIGQGTKVPHLTYVGDGDIGETVNVGAGTIFANYDGATRSKSRTALGDGVFIGSGTILVAPVTLAQGSSTGAGSVVLRNHDVAKGEVVVGVPARPIRAKTKENKEKA